MKMGLYVVLDTKAAMALGGLLQFRHDAAAVRVFQEIYKDPQSAVSKHPADFQLMRVGEFDDESLFVAATEPAVIITGEQLRMATAQEGGSDA